MPRVGYSFGGNGRGPALGLATLFLFFCAAGPAPPPDGSAPAASGVLARTSLEPVAVGDLRISIEISRVANLFHWIDNLALTSAGKTKSVYIEHWTSRFGPLSPADRQVLRGFREARRHLGRPRRTYPEGTGCLPRRLEPLPLRQRLSVAAMSARDPADLVGKARALLPGRQAEALGAALSHFGPRFDSYWKDVRHLRPFSEDLRRFFVRDDVRQLIAAMSRLYQAELDPGVPTTISLIALPANGATHAEADGHHLLIEIRPGDRAEDQAQVVFHELAHDLSRRVPAERHARQAKAFLSRGAVGSMAWSLAHEGLPTALGQGVAQADLTEVGLLGGRPWYHHRDVNQFAKGIYRSVRRDLASGRSIVDRMPRYATKWIERSALSRNSPSDHLGESALMASRQIMNGLAGLDPFTLPRHAWRVRWDEPDGAGFLERFSCVPLVLVATKDELLALPEDIASLFPALSRKRPPIPPGRAGLVVPGRRPSGAPTLLVVLATPRDVRYAVRTLGTSVGWPRGPLEIER